MGASRCDGGCDERRRGGRVCCGPEHEHLRRRRDQDRWRGVQGGGYAYAFADSVPITCADSCAIAGTYCCANEHVRAYTVAYSYAYGYSDAIADQCAYCGTYEVGISACFEL